MLTAMLGWTTSSPETRTRMAFWDVNTETDYHEAKEKLSRYS